MLLLLPGRLSERTLLLSLGSIGQPLLGSLHHLVAALLCQLKPAQSLMMPGYSALMSLVLLHVDVSERSCVSDLVAELTRQLGALLAGRLLESADRVVDVVGDLGPDRGVHPPEHLLLASPTLLFFGQAVEALLGDLERLLRFALDFGIDD
ncbi:hypothetical protein [Bradyrhizobium sp. SZCCHNPS1003]|uniref:hypothetical protein n=2 Tax=unclassified Bradyrhizobium TaxID=2631580 RepID=UPI0028EA1381|nr:hypothetical protein [Bradyrhizobium sp. SZCCHNPS1003]